MPSNTFRCKDGWVYIAVLLDSHWKVLARLIGFPELAEDPAFATFPGRSANRDACNAIVAAWTAERTRGEVVEILNKAEIAVGPVNTYPEAVKDPHVLERDTIQPTQIEDGSIAMLNGPVVKFSRTPTRVRTGAPAIGKHNDEILTEIGIESATRKRLKEAGII